MPRVGRVRNAVLTIALAGAAALSLGAPVAAAQPVQRSHDRGTFTVDPDIVCGITVITTVRSVDNFIERLGRNGFPLFQLTGRITITFTNPATGLSVVAKGTGGTKDLSVTDNGDGTITVRTAVTGIAGQVILGDGTVAYKDVGRVVFATVLDYNRTPANTNDDVFISQSIESVSGPHPQLDSGFTLFCPAVIDGLT
jgi:hypothetical protein